MDSWDPELRFGSGMSGIRRQKMPSWVPFGLGLQPPFKFLERFRLFLTLWKWMRWGNECGTQELRKYEVWEACDCYERTGTPCSILLNRQSLYWDRLPPLHAFLPLAGLVLHFHSWVPEFHIKHAVSPWATDWTEYALTFSHFNSPWTHHSGEPSKSVNNALLPNLG